MFSPIAFLNQIGLQEWLVILLIILLLFGATRLPKLARSMGAGMKEFKKGIQEGAAEEPPDPAKKDSESHPTPSS